MSAGARVSDRVSELVDVVIGQWWHEYRALECAPYGWNMLHVVDFCSIRLDYAPYGWIVLHMGGLCSIWLSFKASTQGMLSLKVHIAFSEREHIGQALSERIHVLLNIVW